METAIILDTIEQKLDAKLQNAIDEYNQKIERKLDKVLQLSIKQYNAATEKIKKQKQSDIKKKVVLEKKLATVWGKSSKKATTTDIKIVKSVIANSRKEKQKEDRVVIATSSIVTPEPPSSNKPSKKVFNGRSRKLIDSTMKTYNIDSGSINENIKSIIIITTAAIQSDHNKEVIHTTKGQELQCHLQQQKQHGEQQGEQMLQIESFAQNTLLISTSLSNDSKKQQHQQQQQNLYSLTDNDKKVEVVVEEVIESPESNEDDFANEAIIHASSSSSSSSSENNITNSNINNLGDDIDSYIQESLYQQQQQRSQHYQPPTNALLSHKLPKKNYTRSVEDSSFTTIASAWLHSHPDILKHISDVSSSSSSSSVQNMNTKNAHEKQYMNKLNYEKDNLRSNELLITPGYAGLKNQKKFLKTEYQFQFDTESEEYQDVLHHNTRHIHINQLTI